MEEPLPREGAVHGPDRELVADDDRVAGPGALRADIEEERQRMFKRYVASKRHTMQVDYDDWMVAAAKERKAGEERARTNGGGLPVARRADMPVAA